MERKYYNLNSAQKVAQAQCQFTLFKYVANILSYGIKDDIDWAVMEKAYNEIVKRNDCLRIHFEKKDKKTVQYFIPAEEMPYVKPQILTFTTEKDYEKFLKKYRKKAIKYMKGQVAEPLFINRADGKKMVLIKVTHLVLDMYGLAILYKDLFGVYEAFKNGTELPECPHDFESIVQKDLSVQENPEYYENNRKFYDDFCAMHEKPCYAGYHGSNNKKANKLLAGKDTMKMFFFRNKTQTAVYSIDSETVKKAVSFCEENSVGLGPFFSFVENWTLSAMNGRVRHTLPLYLVNSRGTVAEKKCAGDKAVSISAYTDFDYEKSFMENLKAYDAQERILERHVGFPDMDLSAMQHKHWKYNMLDSLAASTFSLVPVVKPEGVEFGVLSNGRFVLPCYTAYMLDTQTFEMECVYDYQTVIHTKENMDVFHKCMVKSLVEFLANPSISLNDVADKTTGR